MSIVAPPILTSRSTASMIGYVIRRLLQLLPVLLIASLLVWAMIYAVPGGPVAVIVGENATPEQIEAATERLGLDRPVLVQYATWLKSALLGDLGTSIHSREPVLKLIGQRLPATLQLAAAATLIALLLGVPRRRGQRAAGPAPGSTGSSAAGARWRSACRPSGSASC